MQDFYVLQPGSTVATSLSQSEVSRKNAWIVHVKGSQFKVSIALPVVVFAHMVSCYHEEALNYKLKYNRAYKISQLHGPVTPVSTASTLNRWIPQ